MIKVSLIAPMYCCEEFVVGFLDQMCGQDYTNTEIICVVDGSPDRTLDLLNEYAKKDSRIQIYQQEHKGAGAARNLGLKYAQGEYVMFPDVDDIYASNYVGRMLDAIEKAHADVAVCQFNVEDQQLGMRNYNCGYSLLYIPKDKALKTKSIKGLTYAVSSIPHNKMIRRGLIQEHNLHFSETMSMNDVFFSKASLLSAKTVVFIKDSLFTYKKHRNPKSISTTRGNNPYDLAMVYREYYDWLAESKKEIEQLDDFLRAWHGSLHSYATYCKGTEYVDSVLRVITSEEPWKSMSDRELQECTWLDCALSKRNLKKYKSQISGASTQEQRKSIENRIVGAEREIANCSEIKRRLQEECGKKFDRKETLFRLRLNQVRKAGPLWTIQILYRKILNRVLS